MSNTYTLGALLSLAQFRAIDLTKERDALAIQNAALLRELRATLNDLETWDGTDDAHAVILENLRAAITTAEGLS